MRIFSCFTHDDRSPVSTLFFVFAQDEERARNLARRQLEEIEGGLRVEICENGRLIAIERVEVRP